MTSDARATASVFELTRRRWLVLAASCLINLCVGSLYAWSVFAAPMAERLSELAGAPVTGLAIVFTIANAVGPITMIGGGAVTCRLGPRAVVLAGGCLFAAGMVASGFAASKEMLMLTYGLGVGLGVGMVYGVTVSNSVKLFPDKKGLAGGLATASYGLSSVIVPPIANALTASLGVASSFKVLGLAMLALIVLASTQVVAAPDGFVPEGCSVAAGGAAPAVADRDWRQMLADPIFYVMICMLLCGAFSGLMVTSSASPMAQAMVGMDASAAALAVSALALANGAGRVAAGFLSDRLGAVASLRITFVLLAAAMAALLACGGSVALFYVGLCLTGLCFGAVMGIYPGFTSAQFGARNNSVNYGIMFVGFAAAGFFGPQVMGALLETTGGYAAAFGVACALALLGVALSLVFSRMTGAGERR